MSKKSNSGLFFGLAVLVAAGFALKKKDAPAPAKAAARAAMPQSRKLVARSGAAPTGASLQSASYSEANSTF